MVFPAVSLTPLSVAVYVTLPFNGALGCRAASFAALLYVTFDGTTALAASFNTKDMLAWLIGSLNVASTGAAVETRVAFGAGAWPTRLGATLSTKLVLKTTSTQ